MVLVEGASDQSALETLAYRRNRDLSREGIAIVSMGGATKIGQFLDALGPAGLGLRLAGLCDVGEVGAFARALERAGMVVDVSQSGLEHLDFFVCVADLEDELIRALGTDVVEHVLEQQDEHAAFRTFQNQPAWRGRPRSEQLRRFMGTLSGRKVRYGALLVEALDLAKTPRPLDLVLASV